MSTSKTKATAPKATAPKTTTTSPAKPEAKASAVPSGTQAKAPDAPKASHAITPEEAKAAAAKKSARDTDKSEKAKQAKSDEPIEFKEAASAALVEMIAEARAEDKPVKLHQLGKVMAQGQKFSASDVKAITEVVLDSLVEVMKAEQIVVFPNGMKVRRLRGSERENVDVHILQLREPKDGEDE